MAQINIILFVATNIRSFIIAKATRNSAKGISGTSIWTPFFFSTVCHRFNEFFFYKAVFIGLRDFNSLKQAASVQRPQSKSAVPPRGLATNYNCRRGNHTERRETHLWKGKRRGNEKITSTISNPFSYKAFPRGQWHERKTVAGKEHRT